MDRKLCQVHGPVGFQTEGPLILNLGIKESGNAQAQARRDLLKQAGVYERLGWGFEPGGS